MGLFDRITSFGRFITGKFSIIGADGIPHYFSGFADDLKDKIMKTKLTIYMSVQVQKAR